MAAMRVRKAAKPSKPAIPAAKADPERAEPPPEMARDDRRIIMEKLDDVYGDRGYQASWTDTAVARDLNVPRAWVRDVREAFFGPEGSNPLLDDYTEQKEGFARQLAGFMAARKAQCEAHDRLLKMAMDISKKADDINRLGRRIERELG